jgi:hypothetical protein
MLYSPIELGQPGKEKCPNAYNEASTAWTPGARRIILQVSKQAVFVQFGIMPEGVGAGLGAVRWQSEEPFLPMIASLGRNFDAVRVRNYISGQEAQVLVTFA